MFTCVQCISHKYSHISSIIPDLLIPLYSMMSTPLIWFGFIHYSAFSAAKAM